MAFSAKTWRKLFSILMLCFVALLVRTILFAGYPQEWNSVQVGMPLSQVKATCGRPTYDGSSVKPDYWEKQFFWGKWIMRVDGESSNDGSPDIVYGIDIYYSHEIANYRSHIRSCRPPIRDYAAFIRAFGQTPNPGVEYRIVPKSDGER